MIGEKSLAGVFANNCAFLSSMFLGNLFVYFQFQGKDHIDEGTRRLVFSVLIAVAVLGVIFLGTLQRVSHSYTGDASPQDSELETASQTIVGAFKNAINLFLTKEMLLLSVTFLYTGQSMALELLEPRLTDRNSLQASNCPSSAESTVPASDSHCKSESQQSNWSVCRAFSSALAKYLAAFCLDCSERKR